MYAEKKKTFSQVKHTILSITIESQDRLILMSHFFHNGKK